MRRHLAAALLALTAFPAAAAAHGGSPDYLSSIDSVTPADPGITVQVLNRDDRLLLVSSGERTVVIDGYTDEPYARILPDGTVQVNTNSPAYYLNRDRDQTQSAPAGIEDRPPAWKEVNTTGRFEWHDHRMHWMGKRRPKHVSDPDRRTKVFDWQVPLEVDGKRGAISGTLFWTPRDGGGPLPGWAIGALAALALGGGALALAVRRRRFADASPIDEREAW
jgi:hypothetical protein